MAAQQARRANPRVLGAQLDVTLVDHEPVRRHSSPLSHFGRASVFGLSRGWFGGQVWSALLERSRHKFDTCVPDGIHPGPVGAERVITPGILAACGLTEAKL